MLLDSWAHAPAPCAQRFYVPADWRVSTAAAFRLPQKNKYQLNATQELRGLGLANLAGAMFQWWAFGGTYSSCVLWLLGPAGRCGMSSPASRAGAMWAQGLHQHCGGCRAGPRLWGAACLPSTA